MPSPEAGCYTSCAFFRMLSDVQLFALKRVIRIELEFIPTTFANRILDLKLPIALVPFHLAAGTARSRNRRYKFRLLVISNWPLCNQGNTYASRRTAAEAKIVRIASLRGDVANSRHNGWTFGWVAKKPSD